MTDEPRHLIDQRGIRYRIVERPPAGSEEFASEAGHDLYIDPQTGSAYAVPQPPEETPE
jgi:hypothetical protein